MPDDEQPLAFHRRGAPTSDRTRRSVSPRLVTVLMTLVCSYAAPSRELPPAEINPPTPPHPSSDRPPYRRISPRRAATRHGWPKENPNHRSAHPTSCLYFHDESNSPNQASTARPWTETVYTFNRPSHPKQAAGGDQGCINCTIRPCFVHRVQCI